MEKKDNTPPIKLTISNTEKADDIKIEELNQLNQINKIPDDEKKKESMDSLDSLMLIKEELNKMSVGRLRKTLQNYIEISHHKLTENEIKTEYNYKKFIEKSEYIQAILKFESIIYGKSPMQKVKKDYFN